jgi:hypothetical protein
MKSGMLPEVRSILSKEPLGGSIIQLDGRNQKREAPWALLIAKHNGDSAEEAGCVSSVSSSSVP